MTAISGLNFCSAIYGRINNQNSISSGLKLSTLQQDTVSFSAKISKDSLDLLRYILGDADLNERTKIFLKDMAKSYPDDVIAEAKKAKIPEKASKVYNEDIQAVRNFLNQHLPKDMQI